MKLRWTALLVLPLVLFIVVGCGKKADSSKPINDIKAEVEGMSVKDLESNAKAYAKEIGKLKPEIEKVQRQLKELKPTELLGDKAKSIKNEISGLSTEVSALTKRYRIYADNFQKAGGDIAAVKIG